MRERQLEQVDDYIGGPGSLSRLFGKPALSDAG
jgi:hypothetical protein